jgi:hypothetical protein
VEKDHGKSIEQREFPENTLKMAEMTGYLFHCTDHKPYGRGKF